MKYILVIFLFWIYLLSCFSQSIYIGVSGQIQMDSWSQKIGAGIKVEYPISEIWSFVLDFDLSSDSGNRHNLLYCTSLNLGKWMNLDLWRIKARGGFGWGHYYTNKVTDHNYHTYQIGALFERRIYSKHYIFIYPSANWRTYAEHIGFARDRGWIQIQIGLSFDL